MHRRRTSLFASLALAALVTVGHAQPERVQIGKFQKELQKVGDRITAAESKLVAERDAVRVEYTTLLDTAARAPLLKSMEAAAAATSVGTELEQARVAFEKSFVSAFEAASLPTLARILGPRLAESAAAMTEGGGKIENLAELLQSAISQALPAGEFEADYERVLRGHLSPALAKLVAERAELEDKIRFLEESLQARASGVPPHMARVPSCEIEIGVSSKEIQQFSTKMGATAESLSLAYASYPASTRKVREFFIDQKEVTCAWWAAYLRDNPGLPAPGFARGGDQVEMWKDRNIPNASENRPVTGISAEEAEAFARWLGRRLPTEVEWETAARFGQDGKRRGYWPWGDDWVPGNSNNETFESRVKEEMRVGESVMPLVPVGMFAAGRSPLGIYDLSGNAAEWTSSPFTPYPGFKDATSGARRFTIGDFPPNRVVVRGGHANNRDVVVSSWWRTAANPAERYPWVGFRSAASVDRGRDYLAALDSSGFLKTYLVEYKTIGSDDSENRSYPALELDNPDGFSAITSGGWDEEKGEPTRVRHIALASRKANDFRDHKALQSLAGDDALLIGFLSLDVPSAEPALEPGKYFVLWRNSHVPPEPEAPGAATPEEPGKPVTNGKPAKPAKSAKPKPVPEALMFVKLGGRKADAVRLEKFNPPVTTVAQTTRVVPRTEKDEIELVFAFPTRAKNQSFVVSASLKLAPGVVGTFR